MICSSANCQLGLLKSLLFIMIGQNAQIPRSDMTAIRQCIKSFIASGHQPDSRLFRDMNMKAFLPTGMSTVLDKYFPPVDMRK